MHHPIFLMLGLAAAAAVPPSTADYTGDLSGCGKRHTDAGTTYNHTVHSAGRDRTYHVHLPSSYDEDTPYSVVVGFHGTHRDAAYFEEDTRLSSEDFTPDTIAVYPDGVRGNWAGASYSRASVDEDLSFVEDMLDELRAEYCVDSARIYATGMSLGGGFVDTIACHGEVGGQFAAFASSSAPFYTNNDDNWEDCGPARLPVPVLQFHGGDDPIVPYNGTDDGNGGDTPDIVDWAGRWAERNGCDDEGDKHVMYDGEVEHWSWCDGLVQHYRTDHQSKLSPSLTPQV